MVYQIIMLVVLYLLDGFLKWVILYNFTLSLYVFYHKHLLNGDNMAKKKHLVDIILFLPFDLSLTTWFIQIRVQVNQARCSSIIILMNYLKVYEVINIDNIHIDHTFVHKNGCANQIHEKCPQRMLYMISSMCIITNMSNNDNQMDYIIIWRSEKHKNGVELWWLFSFFLNLLSDSKHKV